MSQLRARHASSERTGKSDWIKRERGRRQLCRTIDLSVYCCADTNTSTNVSAALCLRAASQLNIGRRRRNDAQRHLPTPCHYLPDARRRPPLLADRKGRGRSRPRRAGQLERANRPRRNRSASSLVLSSIGLVLIVVRFCKKRKLAAEVLRGLVSWRLRGRDFERVSCGRRRLRPRATCC